MGVQLLESGPWPSANNAFTSARDWSTDKVYVFFANTRGNGSETAPVGIGSVRIDFDGVDDSGDPAWSGDEGRFRAVGAGNRQHIGCYLIRPSVNHTNVTARVSYSGEGAGTPTGWTWTLFEVTDPLATKALTFPQSFEQVANATSVTQLVGNVTTVAGSVVLDCLQVAGGPTTATKANVEQTQERNGTGSTAIHAISSRVATGTSTGMGWTFDVAGNGVLGAIRIDTASGPGQPSIDSVGAIDDDEIRLNVTAGSGADGHTLYGSNTQGFTPGAGNLLVGGLGASITEVIDTGYNGTPRTWYFVLRATNASGDTDSAEFTVVFPPDRPTTVSLSGITQNEITVNWSGGGTGTQDKTDIQRKLTSEPDTGYQGVYFGSEASYEDTGLTAGTSYDYILRLMDANGFSRYTDAVTGETLSAAGGMMMLRRRRGATC